MDNTVHTKVHRFQLANNYSSSQPFVDALLVAFTNTGGPFITVKGGRCCEGSVFLHTQTLCFCVYGFEIVVIWSS